MPLFIPVLYGTTREGRHSIGVARFVRERLARRPDVETALFDPRDLPFGNLVEREWKMDPRPPEVARFVDEMARADAFVVVTPEYNFGVPGALKNMLDHVYDEWNRKPFGLIGAGGVSGGLRALDNLRQVVAGLSAVAVPAHLGVQFVRKEFDEDGPLDAEKWARRVDRVLDEVEWYARALKPAREARAKADEA